MSVTQVLLLDEQNLFRESFALRVSTSEGLVLAGETNSWDEANELLATIPVQVLFVSGTLTGINSYHGLRLLRSRFPRVQVALLDTYFVQAHLHQAIAAGAMGYFTRCDHFECIETGLQSVAAGKPAYTRDCTMPVRVDSQRELASGASESQLTQLSARELEVLRHLAEGLSVRQSAEKLSLARSTVDNHKSRLMRKLNVHKSADLTRIAIREGLVSM